MAKKIRKLSYYKNKAWKVFSIYIRTRDCLATTKTAENGKCVTCNRVFPFEELQAGHAIGGLTSGRCVIVYNIILNNSI